jgi:hypothetical protein
MTENPYQAPATVSEAPAQLQDKPDGSIAYGVGVRIFGLANMVYGAWYAFFGFLYATGVPEANEGDAKLNFGGGMFLFLAGLLLTGFAPLIVRLSYPKSRFAEHV